MNDYANGDEFNDTSVSACQEVRLTKQEANFSDTEKRASGERQVRALLERIASGDLSVSEAIKALRWLPFEQIDGATIDHHRELRTGATETVYCEGKTADQVASIVERLAARSPRVLGTRANHEQYAAARKLVDDLQFHELARCIWLERQPFEKPLDGISLICAGTSDLPVAEEAAMTLRMLGHRATRITDVGVAGLHRLLPHVRAIQEANVIVVVAGMEGALPSVVAGLTSSPVIAVPTSVGYGASLGGIAALLGMLNSCASGIGVVNIDNGFGAAMLAASINRRKVGSDG